MIEGVALNPLRQFVDERGRTMHMLYNDDPHFRHFGEIYFSGVRHGKVKGLVPAPGENPQLRGAGRAHPRCHL